MLRIIIKIWLSKYARIFAFSCEMRETEKMEIFYMNRSHSWKTFTEDSKEKRLEHCSNAMTIWSTTSRNNCTPGTLNAGDRRHMNVWKDVKSRKQSYVKYIIVWQLFSLLTLRSLYNSKSTSFIEYQIL